MSRQPTGDFRFETFNDAFAAALGCRKRIASGKLVHHALPRSIAKTILDRLRACAETHGTMRFEMVLPRGKRHSTWEFALVPLQGGPKGVLHIIGRAEEKSTPPNAGVAPVPDRHMLERLAATSHDILYIFDLADRKLVYVNDRVKSVLGYGAGDLLAADTSPLRDLVHPADRPILLDHYAQLASLSDHAVRSVDYRVRGADGYYAWLRSSDAVFSRKSDGAVRQIIGSAIDVTHNRHLLKDLKRISSQLLETQNEERRRIARELHDSTAQHLVALTIGLARLGHLIRRDGRAISGGAEMADVIDELRSVSRQAQQEIRTLSFLLHPPVLETIGLAEALRTFITGFSRRTGIRAQLTVSEGFSCGSHGISTALMRIAQEALVNVFRHAKASHVSVTLANNNRRAVLEVVDDGKGLPPEDAGNADESSSFGVGISGMRARVQQFHGELQISSTPNGTIVRASIPERAASLVDTRH